MATTDPYGPTTYQAYGIDDTGHLQVIGAFSILDTMDHLVAAWQNSTSCFGSDISRNAWVADAIGRVYGESEFSGPPATNFGDASNLPLNRPIVGMTPTADGGGYWLVASDGGIFSFGDAAFHGSTGSLVLNKPVVGMTTSPDGGGYLLAATDGGVFAFGDAGFFGSVPGQLKPGQVLNKPIEGVVMTPDGGGYWMVASDGGVFCFGDAPFLGSKGGSNLSAPIAGMIANGVGYTLVGEDGQLYPFG